MPLRVADESEKIPRGYDIVMSASTDTPREVPFDGAAAVAMIERDLESRGFHVLEQPIRVGSFYHLGRCLGSVLRIEDIKLGNSPRGAHSPRELGLHTDQHYVDRIAWYCVRAAEIGGATRLVDSRPILDSLSDDDRDRLGQITMRCPDVDGRLDATLVPLLSRDSGGPRVYYAAWNVAPIEDPAVRETFRRFSDAIESSPRIDVRLEPGQSLYVDNTRIVHGRGELPKDSPRTLKRFWIRRHLAGGDLVH